MVETRRQENESVGHMLRRFSKRVQLSGFLQRVRSRRYHKTDKSDYTKKKEALRRVAWQKNIEYQRKLGKID